MLQPHQEVPKEIIEADIRKFCGRFDLEPAASSGTIKGSVSAQPVGPFQTVGVALSHLRIIRDAQAIKRDPGEHFFLLTQRSGTSRVVQAGQEVVLKQGDMFLVDSTQASVFHYDQSLSHQLSFHIPRSEMLGRFGQSVKGGTTVSRDDPLWLAINAVISKMIDGQEHQSHLGEAFFNLLGGYFVGARNARDPSDSERLLSRALALIDQHCSNPDFGPSSLATSLNVSKRTLQRHFQPLGETPGQRILMRRLALAHRRLTGALIAGSKQTITDVILDCGFNDVSYFYREFRKKYGVAPGEVVTRH
ncbi:hypothetical protein NBRC116596_28000 [Litorivita sp. NS0012-18]